MTDGCQVLGSGTGDLPPRKKSQPAGPYLPPAVKATRSGSITENKRIGERYRSKGQVEEKER